MTIEQRKKQLKYRKALFFMTVVLIICWMPFFTKYFGCSACNPVGGYTSYLADITAEAMEERIFNDEVVVDDIDTEIVEEENDSEEQFMLVDSTAYYDKYNVKKVHGYTLQSNYSLAGMIEWRGKKCELYRCNKDGSVGDYIGTFQFQDTGYGQSTGNGKSRLLKGKTLGTIETGECIDVFKSSYQECMNWGRRKVYIKWID